MRVRRLILFHILRTYCGRMQKTQQILLTTQEQYHYFFQTVSEYNPLSYYSTTNSLTLFFRRRDLGDFDRKGSAFSGLAVKGYGTTQFLYNVVCDPQTQTGALAGLFGGKEGVKNTLLLFLRYAGAIIRDGHING
ncbi:hypothetical protein PITCH_A230136 [uncultured Desulfobacterium sp.]|uniref:Uncharacterized protein n=1 Tax=uncultured Desulfobacterium sp. TaxID=201089 RepID=A0A445MY82_9BACT|nr:hypothetical protein PITCH_A230136 [uncultured Desulfobacterium sp.]